jgi:hypothetical protein
MSWTITPALKHPAAAVTDPDARTYLLAVEQADGQFLESGVATAINTFVTGCKADGIWTAIKASCILAGARTLTGALVPLAGTAPTSFNFVDGDYNRKTGLVGNKSSKYLNANRNANQDTLNSNHISVFISAPATESSSVDFYISAQGAARNQLYSQGSGGGVGDLRHALQTNSIAIDTSFYLIAGLYGGSRSSSDSYVVRFNQANQSISATGTAIGSADYTVFARDPAVGAAFPTNARLAFYSIGESLNLALLDARVTDLINALSAAIP